MEIVFTLSTLQEAVATFWKAVGSKKVFAFHGEMGAGKTTFIQALCLYKGVKDTVGSPTFSIINEYAYDCEGTQRALFHMDLYRLKSEQEAVQAGVEDCLYSGELCLVEWPEKAPGIFPEDTVQVFLQQADSHTRKLIINRN